LGHRLRAVCERVTQRPVRDRTSGLRHTRLPLRFTYDFRRVDDPIRFRDLRALRRADNDRRRDDERRTDDLRRQRLVTRDR
jgi:hypothetical protein